MVILSRLFTVGLMCVLAGCRPGGDEGSTEAFPIVFQLDWVPEPQHGGLYAAQAAGLFAAEGLAVELVPGGANADVRLRVGQNRAQFGQVEGNNALLAAAEGVPLKIVAALFHHDPSVFLYHADQPIDDWQDLDGARVRSRPNWAFHPFVTQTLGISYEMAPIDYGLAVFAADPEVIQQGYYIAEPFYLQEQGIAVRWLHVWDAGYDGLSAIVSNPAFLAAHPDEARAFLRAYYRGQKLYFEGDPGPAHALMLEANPRATPEFLAWSRAQIIDQRLADGMPERGGTGDYLRLTPERIARQITQLELVGELEPGALTIETVFDGTYLPETEGPDATALANPR